MAGGRDHACRVWQVPEMWARVGYPSLKPLAAWVPDLVARLAFVQRGWSPSRTTSKRICEPPRGSTSARTFR